MAIPHRVLRGQRSHEGWGPGGAQACPALPAAGCADELGLPSLEGAEEEVHVKWEAVEGAESKDVEQEEGGRRGDRSINASCPTGSRRLHPREQVAACAGRGQMTKRSKKTV